ncbi:MAG: radical SAM protein [Planctomycetes bacterium]|nr:radical SAM protein [Planctomycetota bacterium]
MAASSDILNRLQAKAYRECIPLNTTFEITLRCNLRCVHCYNFDREEPYPHSECERELSSDEIRALIPQIRDLGGLYLAFTGGEPLLHPDIYDFIRRAADLRMYVSLKTNGTLLTKPVVRRLDESGTAKVHVSLYGASAPVHDGITVGPGSFDRTVRGLRNVIDGGLLGQVNFCMMKDNLHEVPRMPALAESLGVSYNLDPQITGRYDGNLNALAQKIEADDLAPLYRGPLRSLAKTADQPHPDAGVQCACARSVLGITARGEVYPCIGAPVPSGNVRRRPLAQIWRESPELNRIRRLTLPDFPVCAPCPDRPFCRRSSGAVYAITGDYTGPEPFTCREAQILHEIYEEGRMDGSGSAEQTAAGVMERHSREV